MGLPKIHDRKMALQKAKNKSQIDKTVLFVIESSEVSITSETKIVYYIDVTNNCRKWEKVIATFESGTKI